MSQSQMDLLLVNLLVQFLAALICLYALRRLRRVGATAPMLGHRPRHLALVKYQNDERPSNGEWKSDPLTEARTELRSVQKELQELRDSTAASKLKQDFITREEFAPIQRIVYGAVGLTLLTVASSILVLILRTSTTTGMK